jgi:hypothetical protein
VAALGGQEVIELVPDRHSTHNIALSDSNQECGRDDAVGQFQPTGELAVTIDERSEGFAGVVAKPKREAVGSYKVGVCCVELIGVFNDDGSQAKLVHRSKRNGPESAVYLNWEPDCLIGGPS